MASRETSDMPPGKWWGWGDPDKRASLSKGALEMLCSELGEATPALPVALDQVSLDEPRPLPAAVAAVLEPDAVFTDHEHRVRRAAGKSYPDLLRMRSGVVGAAPDTVVMPSTVEQVAAVLAACAEAGVAVVPFGGGTSVVGGVAPIAGVHETLISLDLRRMRDVDVDRTSLTATIGPGLRGPQAEEALAARGVTLGHFPQSFEYATIGGFAATRSAGQASSGYGRFDELVTSVAMTTPIGELRTLQTPHTAAGPSLRELALGSEGVLGAITEVSVRVRPTPSVRRYEGWMVEDFTAGRDLIRSLAQADALPDVARLSDETETRISLGLANTVRWKKSLFDSYLSLRRRQGGCLVICGWEGERESVERRRSLSATLLRRGGAAALGEAPGRAWEHARFDGPYLRDELMDRGYFVDTLESSHTWTRLEPLYLAVGGALDATMRSQDTPGIVMCHLSHAYRDGASLYFTFVCRARRGEELDQWRALKTAACEAIVSVGATITHHHAVGTDHEPYMEAEVGTVGLDALRAIKERLDPAGIMNPAKLLG